MLRVWPPTLSAYEFVDSVVSTSVAFRLDEQDVDALSPTATLE